LALDPARPARLLGFEQTATSTAGNSATYQYNSAGDLLGDGLATYRYDSEGRMQSARNQRGQVQEFLRQLSANKKGSQKEPSLLGQHGCLQNTSHGSSTRTARSATAMGSPATVLIGQPITWR